MGLGHFTIALKKNPFVDTEARRQDVASKNSRVMNLYPVSRFHRSIHLPVNDHRAGLNLAVNAGAFANDERIWGEDLASKTSPDSDRSLEAKLSFKLTTLINDSGDDAMTCGGT